MARYVIKQGKIWDGLMKRWVINGSHNSSKIVKQMCDALNKAHHDKTK